MTKTGKRVLAIVVAIVVVLLLVGPLSVWRWLPGLKKPAVSYKVGAAFAVTGPAAWLGTPERNTVKMIEEKINAEGGINGHPLEVIVEDTVGDPTKAVTAVKKLIDKDEVLAVIGPSRSGTTMAVIPIVEEAQVPLISCAAAESIVVPVKRWVFKTPQKDSDAAVRIYEYMNEKGISKIAIVTGTTGFGDQGRQQLKKLAPEFAITIVADETYGPEDTDMTAQLTKIKATEAQAVVNWSIVAGQAIVAKNMRQLGMEIPLFQSHGFGNVKYAEAAGEAGEGIIFPAGRLLAVDTLADDHPQKEVLAKYKEEYEAKFKEDVSTFGGHAWDALYLVIEVLEEVGPDKEKIREYIENRKGFVGTGGVFDFSPEDHSGLDKEAFEMLIVKGGKFAVLK